MKSSTLIVLIFALAATSMPHEEQSTASLDGGYAAPPKANYSPEVKPSDYAADKPSDQKDTSKTADYTPMETSKVDYKHKEGKYESKKPDEYMTKKDDYKAKEKDTKYEASVKGYEAPVKNDYNNSTGSYDVGKSPSTTVDLDSTPTSTTVMDWRPAPTGYNGNVKKVNGTITVDVTYNGQKHPCSVSSDLHQGSVSVCASAVGVTEPTNPSDISGKFCFAIRVQIAKFPGCEGAAKGGILAAQVVGEASAQSTGTGGIPAFNSSDRSVDVSYRNAIAVALCLASTVFAFAM